MLTNLLANARTNTPAGTTMTVGLGRGDGGARLTVTDDGPGITPDLLPHVFERFARGSVGRSRHTGSTGLGLAIVDAVVAAHGGTVSVHSRPGRTEFVVWLPDDSAPPGPRGASEGNASRAHGAAADAAPDGPTRQEDVSAASGSGASVRHAR